jgi:hypothetical protein
MKIYACTSFYLIKFVLTSVCAYNALALEMQAPPVANGQAQARASVDEILEKAVDALRASQVRECA